MNELSLESTQIEQNAKPQTHAQEPTEKDSFFGYDLLFGSTMAIFAAILSVNDLGAGKYGADELQTTNDKASSYAWYQSKSIKESLAEGQYDLLSALTTGGFIKDKNSAEMLKLQESFKRKAQRYKKEKNEILLGSANVGKENWVQDVEGQMGKVIGTKELEAKLSQLGKAGDRFDLSSLFLQISLVVGAIGILLRQPTMKNIFFGMMLVLGSVGLVFCVLAYWLANTIPV